MTDAPQTPQVSLGTAAARNLAKTSNSAMQGVTTPGESMMHLRQPTRELLRNLKHATPELRRLALLTSPFGVRAELFAHGFATDDFNLDGRACELTARGLLALERSEGSGRMGDADPDGRHKP